MTKRFIAERALLWSAGNEWWFVEAPNLDDELADLLAEPLSRLPDSDDWREEMEPQVRASHEALRMDPDDVIAPIGCGTDWLVQETKYVPHQPGSPAVVFAFLGRSIQVTIN